MILPRYAPETHAHDTRSPCRRGCCWTPYGHSKAAPRSCTCHWKESHRG